MDTTIKRFHATPFEYLTKEQMQEIHAATLMILEEVGVCVHHAGALQLLKEAGCCITEEKKLVYIPGGLVEYAIKRAPSSVTVYDRNGNAAMILQGRNTYYGSGSDCPSLLDSFTHQKRPWTYKDNEDAARLLDALPYLDFIMSMGLISDAPKELSYEYAYAAMIRNTTKPQVITASDLESLHTITNIAAAVVGGREQLSRKPIFVLYDEPTSPLKHSFTALDKLLFMAENRLPTNYAPGMMAGATGPITMAGAMTQANAEILSGLVIHQLKNAGAPFVFGAGMSPIDMRSMQPTYSAPEAMIEQAGLLQLGREMYELPTWGFGGCSASKCMDEQAVNEAATYIMMAGLAGTNLTHDCGYLEFGLTFSYDLLVICDEVIGQVRRLMEGIPVNKDTLALEAIRRVGPEGHFLGDEHTLQHFKENWQPGVTDRNTYDVWEKRGKTTMAQRAAAKVKKILETHVPQPLPDDVNAAIDKILQEAMLNLSR